MREEIYVYPEKARKKLKLAQELFYTVYIYGAVGFGKTAVIRHYLNRRDYLYLDAATVREKDLMLPVEKQGKAEKKKIVVIDNIQYAEPEEVRKAIRTLVSRKDVWLILSGRCKCPSWLLSVSLARETFVIIEEAELQLTEKEIQTYLELHGIYMDEDKIKRIRKDSKGNGLSLKILASRILQEDKDFSEEPCLYDDRIYREVREVFWNYIENEVYAQWDTGFTEFFMQMSVVDNFTVRMAEEISGRKNVEAILQKAFETGSFLLEKDGSYVMVPAMLHSMRRRMKLRYTKEQRDELYYNAGRCYMRQGQTLQALAMFEACGSVSQISNVLIENARTNPGNGYLFELRKYYLTLPEEVIMDNNELCAGMCMLQSFLLRPEESERWYNVLKEKQKTVTGRQRVQVKGWIAYLDIGLPHRGSEGLTDVFKSVGVLLTNREIILPEFSVTSNMPSQMNGGKDFCEWSRKDRELAGSIGKVLALVLGKYGTALVELALAESFFEKGEDYYEVIRRISKGQMQAESQGKLEQCFVAVGLLVNVHILLGHMEDAKRLLSEFQEKAERESAEKLLPNIHAFFCRLFLYQDERPQIAEWMKEAPGDMEDFNPLDRYRYLVKVRVYLMCGKYELAQGILERMLYYAGLMHRTYIRMECELLMAILQYRQGQESWKAGFQKVYTEIEDYHFVRIISREGCAVLPLLKAEAWKVKDKKFMEQVLQETKSMAEYYPFYLKKQESQVESFPENAIRILRMQAYGKSNQQIADELGINIGTVKYHCKQTYKKLGVTGKTAAVMEARKWKLI